MLCTVHTIPATVVKLTRTGSAQIGVLLTS